MITGVGKLMKRSVIKISLAIFVVGGILLGLLVVKARDSGPEVSFSFLDGRTLRARIKQDPGKRFYSITREIYSFAADFNGVCAGADAELSAMGFKVASSGSRGISDREYRLGDHTSANNWIVVRIHDNIDLRAYSSPKSSRVDFQWHCPRKGWVSVEVYRSRLRSWPPKNFLIRLQLMWYRSANKPPAQNKNAGAGNKQGPGQGKSRTPSAKYR